MASRWRKGAVVHGDLASSKNCPGILEPVVHRRRHLVLQRAFLNRVMSRRDRLAR